ncbi:MAG: hypothetical protein FJ088_16715, partial [Deltaproteobacteria bacterium]|nr:hypothetical protein [Deltaproteobacteria bacterium]
MDSWLLLGLVAGLFTTVGFVPQMIRAMRTRKMDDVSILMPIVLSIGMILWLVYGLVLQDLAIVLWNAIA